MHPISDADLLPQGTVAVGDEVMEPEVGAVENNGSHWGTNDRTDNNSITHRDHFTAVLQLSNTSEAPDICSASDLCPSFHVFFIYLSSSPVYLLLLRLSCSPGQQISLVEAAALLCLF